MTHAVRLPENWATATLPDLVGERGILSDGDWVETKDQDPSGDVRLTQLADVGDGVFRDRSLRFMTSAKATELNCTYLEKDDVMIARMPDPLGRACLFPGGGMPSVTAVDVCIVRPGAEEVSNQWLMHTINSPQFRMAASQLQSGSTRKRISKKNLCTISLPVPPTAEQHRIAEAIESYLTRLDDAVASLERVQRNLERCRASVLKAAVEGRLVPTEAELARREGRSYQTAKESVDRVETPPRPNKYKSRSRSVIPGECALAVGNPGTPLSEGWSWVPLLEIARMESGHTPSRRHPEWWGGDIPWIGIKDARAHHGGRISDTLQHTNEDGLANSAARLLPRNTVCLSRTASVGYVVITSRPMATSQDFVNWICTGAIEPRWLQLVILAEQRALPRFGKGTVHTTIYYPEVLSLHIALPPVEEQRRIISKADAMLSILEKLQVTAARALERVPRIRQSILKWAFEGRLAEQDPNDEPASALLERIKPGGAK